MLLGEKIMSDGIRRMYEDEQERAHNKAIDKFKSKDPIEVYLLLKDLQSDFQYLAYDDTLNMTRNQWAAFSRIQAVMKELMK